MPCPLRGLSAWRSCETWHELSITNNDSGMKLTTAAELKAKRLFRERVLKVLGTRKLTTAQLAAEMGKDTETVRYALMTLRKAGMTTHDGRSAAPKWWAVEERPAPQEIVFRPQADPRLKAMMSQAWRGTWLQGLEAVL